MAGHQTVTMADVRAAFDALGLTDVQTVLQSGNVVFRTPPGKRSNLAGSIESALRERLGLVADAFVRSGDDLRQIVARNPFADAAERDPARFVLILLKDAPPASALSKLQAAIVRRETVRADGPHLYAIYPDGQGRSKLTTALIERTLATRATARNWNTIRRLLTLTS
ncbi:MAG: DUF1697 domain-containing protein [Candidatus Eremiobacteraeota bacterium]|nr:DUF1697 domain-containing protein [Candidatus Eremiobacteraeota bacterium]